MHGKGTEIINKKSNTQTTSFVGETYRRSPSERDVRHIRQKEKYTQNTAFHTQYTGAERKNIFSDMFRHILYVRINFRAVIIACSMASFARL